MPANLLQAQLRAIGVTVEFGGSVVLDGVTLTVSPGDRIGLVGPNGAGKSTLLNVLAGLVAPTQGSVQVMPLDAAVGLVTQELATYPGETVAGYIARRTGVAAASTALDQATDALAAIGGGDSTESADGGDRAHSGVDPVEQYQTALDRWLRLGGADLDTRADAALDAVGLTGRHGITPGALEAARLSGGEQARVGLAVLLTARYDVLLLDEPTNDLDTAGLDQLEEMVLSSPAPIVVVSHDRRFLERVVTSVVEIDGHDHTAAVYHEPWASYLHAREIARREAEQRYLTNQAERSRLQDRARRQRTWGTKKQRVTDGDKSIKAREEERAEKTGGKVRHIARELERLDEVDKPWEPWQLQFSIGQTSRSGDLVVELVDAQLDRGPFHLGPVTLDITAGERVAVVGDNGHGKTTLVHALLGHLPLTSGRQRTGRSVVSGWLDQTRGRLTAPGDFLDRFSAEAGLPAGEARGVLAKFGLTADHLSRPAGTEWSPGERTRAVLALFQATGVNTIVLDEPTNHLDLPAIEQLEQALGRFEGTLVLISHDRAFTSAVALTRSITVSAGLVVADTLL